MRKDITITAEPRETRGKNEARRLRVKGFSPAVVYGGGIDPIAIAVNPKDVNSILRSASGHNTIFNVDIQGSIAPVMVVDWQHDPIKGRLLHVDLKRIDLTKRIVVKVPVHTHGDPKGVKLQGGLHEVITREVEIECLPADIPTEFKVDISGLKLNQALRASELPLDTTKMKLLTEPDRVLSHVVTLREEEEKPADVAAVAGATPAEPEVIKKGKKDAEGEEGEEGAKGGEKTEKKK